MLEDPARNQSEWIRVIDVFGARFVIDGDQFAFASQKAVAMHAGSAGMTGVRTGPLKTVRLETVVSNAAEESGGRRGDFVHDFARRSATPIRA
jgi:hypothetical protein